MPKPTDADDNCCKDCRLVVTDGGNWNEVTVLDKAVNDGGTLKSGCAGWVGGVDTPVPARPAAAHGPGFIEATPVGLLTPPGGPSPALGTSGAASAARPTTARSSAARTPAVFSLRSKPAGPATACCDQVPRQCLLHLAHE